MDDHEHPELDFDPLDDTKTWPENDFPLRQVGHDDAQPRRRRTSSPRASRSRSAPACWSTGWTSPTTRCSSAGRSPTPTPSATGSGPNYLQLPVNAPRTPRSPPTSATAQMAYYVDSSRARTRTSTTSRRSPAGCARRRSPRTTSRARRSPAASPARGSRAPTTTQQAGERYLLSEQWEKDDLVANLIDGLLGQCDRPDPGADGLAPVHGRGRARPAGRRRHRHLRRRRPRPRAAADPGLDRGRAAARWRTSATTARATSSGLVMTHCVPNEHASLHEESAAS